MGIKDTKILLPAVILIWGFLIFQVYSYLEPQEIDMPITTSIAYENPKVVEKKQFSLKAIDRDPFLGNLYVKKKKKITSNRVKKTNIESSKPWPNIQFLGIVEDKKTNAKVYILNINGKEELLSIGQSIDDVTLISGTFDDVSLRFQNETKEFSIL